MRDLGQFTVAICLLIAAVGAAPDRSPGATVTRFDGPDGVRANADRSADRSIVRLREALQRRGAMPSLEAKFRQIRTTPLLVRPIESTGTVRHVDGITLWTTESPRRSLMRITKRQVELLHFDSEDDGSGRGTGGVHEVHPLDDRSAALAAIGPEPDLDRITSVYLVTDDAHLQGERDPDAWLAIRLTPRERDDRSSIDAISLLVDLGRGLIVRVVTHDRDGGSTSTEFVEIHERPELTVEDVAMNVPATDLPPGGRSRRPDGGAAGAGAP